MREYKHTAEGKINEWVIEQLYLYLIKRQMNANIQYVKQALKAFVGLNELKRYLFQTWCLL